MNRPEALLRLEAAPVGHLATVRPDGSPHLVPITFALIGADLVHMVDHKPKTTRHLQRLDNVAANPMASVLVDHYEDDWARLWWVRVDGPVTVLGAGPRWESARTALGAKYPQYRVRPPEGPAVVLAIEHVSWWEG